MSWSVSSSLAAASSWARPTTGTGSGSGSRKSTGVASPRLRPRAYCALHLRRTDGDRASGGDSHWKPSRYILRGELIMAFRKNREGAGALLMRERAAFWPC